MSLPVNQHLSVELQRPLGVLAGGVLAEADGTGGEGTCTRRRERREGEVYGGVVGFEVESLGGGGVLQLGGSAFGSRQIRDAASGVHPNSGDVENRTEDDDGGQVI